MRNMMFVVALVLAVFGCKNKTSSLQAEKDGDLVTCTLEKPTAKLSLDINLASTSVACIFKDQSKVGIIADQKQINQLRTWLLGAESTVATTGENGPGRITVAEPVPSGFTSFPNGLVEAGGKNINIPVENTKDIDMQTFKLNGFVKKSGTISLFCTDKNVPSPLCIKTQGAYTIPWPTTTGSALECTFTGLCSKKNGNRQYATAHCQSGTESIDGCVVGTYFSENNYSVVWRDSPDEYVYSFSLKTDVQKSATPSQTAKCPVQIAADEATSNLGCTLTGFKAKSVKFTDGITFPSQPIEQAKLETPATPEAKNELQKTTTPSLVPAGGSACRFSHSTGEVKSSDGKLVGKLNKASDGGYYTRDIKAFCDRCAGDVKSTATNASNYCVK